MSQLSPPSFEDAGPAIDFERRFDQLRARIGYVLAPAVFVAMLAWDAPDLSTEAHRLAAVMATVIVLWITEALPMPVTALLGAAACVALGVAPAKDVFAPFADQLMFLFIGSFILARAIMRHGLDRRLAFAVLSLPWVGASPGRILFAFGAVTAAVSGWISNTATTAMMLMIGLSIVTFLREHEDSGGPKVNPIYFTGLMLMTSFAASIGGLATPIGTPPNVIGLGYIREQLGVELTFFEWMLIGVPVTFCLFLFLYAWMSWLCPAGTKEFHGSHELLAQQRAELGPWSRGEISTLIAFLVTVSLWVLPGIVSLVAGEESDIYRTLRRTIPESVAALTGAGLLFVLPGDRGHRAITWPEAVQIDWGVVLLYGGGFALGILSTQTGLADVVGRGLTGLLPVSGSLGLLIGATFVAALVSEATSNTAAANIVVPVVIALANAAGIDPLEPALGATIGSSLGFMLPVSTPCNAIVYGTGLVPLTRMIRYGIALDIAGVAVVVVLVRLLLPFVR